MADTWVAVAAGLGAAFAYGAGSAVQHDQVSKEETRGGFNPGLLGQLARRPLWLLGIVADGLAVALQTVALRFGPVALVQLLVVGGLPIAVLLSALSARTALRSRQVVGLLLCTVGLACAVPASTTVGLGRPAGRATWVGAVALAAIAVVLLLAIAHRARHVAGLAHGLAAGIAAGTSSVLLAVCAARLGHLPRLLSSPVPYAALAAGLVALLLTQQAFQSGSLGAPLAALSVAEPAVAVFLAVAVLHQRLPSTPGVLAVGATGVLSAVVGVLLLARDGARPVGSTPAGPTDAGRIEAVSQ